MLAGRSKQLRQVQSTRSAAAGVYSRSCRSYRASSWVPFVPLVTLAALEALPQVIRQRPISHIHTQGDLGACLAGVRVEPGLARPAQAPAPPTTSSLPLRHQDLRQARAQMQKRTQKEAAMQTSAAAVGKCWRTAAAPGAAAASAPSIVGPARVPAPGSEAQALGHQVMLPVAR